jgi:hypothetical protein
LLERILPSEKLRCTLRESGLVFCWALHHSGSSPFACLPASLVMTPPTAMDPFRRFQSSRKKSGTLYLLQYYLTNIMRLV